MSIFIVRIELHPSDKEPAYSAVHASMEASGFSRIYRDQNGVRHHLPSSEYCITAVSTVEAVLELARQATGKVTTQFMVMVSETARIAFAGLVPVGPKVAPAAPSVPPVAASPAAFRAA